MSDSNTSAPGKPLQIVPDQAALIEIVPSDRHGSPRPNFTVSGLAFAYATKCRGNRNRGFAPGELLMVDLSDPDVTLTDPEDPDRDDPQMGLVLVRSIVARESTL